MKKIILSIFVLMLVIPLVSAGILEDLKENLLFGLNMNNLDTENSSQKLVGIPTGNFFNTTLCINQTHGCYYGTDSGEMVEWDISTKELLYKPEGNLTVSFWVNIPDKADINTLFWTRMGTGVTGEYGIAFQWGTGEQFYHWFVMSDGVVFGKGAGITMDTDVWQHVLVQLNYSDISQPNTETHLFINGTQVAMYEGQDNSGFTDAPNQTMRFGWNKNLDAGRSWEGGVQGFYIFNRTVNQNEIDWLSSPYRLLVEEFPDTIKPVLTVTSPNASQDHDKRLQNFTYTAACQDLFIDKINASAFNTTDTILSVENSTAIGNETGLNNVLDLNNVGIGNYSINYTCYDLSNNQESSLIAFIISESTVPVPVIEEELLPLENVIITVTFILVIVALFGYILSTIKGGKK